MSAPTDCRVTTPDPTDARADGQFAPTHRSGYDTPTLDAIAQRVAKGYAISPSEARVLLEEVRRLREATQAFVTWLDHDEAGPQYSNTTRDTPVGRAIWQAWWDRALWLCDRARSLGRAALEAK